MKTLIPFALVLLLAGCAPIAEKLVDTAIKHCMTFDGFSGARNQCKR